MKSLNVFDEFTAEERMTRIGGEKLRNKILEGYLEIDFNHRPVASVSFLDEGIAKLILEGWTPQEMQTRLKIKNIHARDMNILKDLIEERSKGLKR